MAGPFAPPLRAAPSPFLRPVVQRVPEAIRAHPLRGRAPLLSRFAREAVLASARRNGLDFFSLDALKKSAAGVPLPVRGWHWSLSHKTEFVAGVVAPVPVGIDLELPGPRHPGLFDKMAEAAEWDCLGGRTWPLFFRLWTAKEAVLKAMGVGLTGLGDCRLLSAAEDRMELAAGGRRWSVASVEREPLVLALTAGDADVAWMFRDDG